MDLMMVHLFNWLKQSETPSAPVNMLSTQKGYSMMILQTNLLYIHALYLPEKKKKDCADL